MSSYSYFIEDDFSEKQTIESASFLSLGAANLDCRILTTQNSSKTTSSIPQVLFDIKSNRFVLNQQENQLGISFFSQYTLLSINFLIEMKKSNLAFPFKYFW